MTKEGRIMRADRLLAILLLLQSRGRMTAQQLAQRLEVSERTIYRDLESLDTAGIPLEVVRGRRGGCALIAGYRTELTGLSAPRCAPCSWPGPPATCMISASARPAMRRC
jgi:predicted DNA-binding transcriptional regulator YafY